MEQINSKEFDEQNLQFIIDDFEIDGLDFKPVTSGLGFHGEKEKITPSFLEDQKPKRRDYSPLKKERTLQHTPQAMNLDHMSKGLESFYGKRAAPKQEVEKIKKVEVKAAKLSHQLTSYTIDLFVISLSLVMTSGLFCWLAFSDLSLPVYKYFLSYNYDFIALLGLLYYIVYFTLIDGVGSIGKRMLSLRVVSKSDKKNPTLVQMFNRSFLCLLGSLFLFIPSILDIHGRLSDTTVVDQ
jgi:uncharacterized RDD family membrane protein YckC